MRRRRTHRRPGRDPFRPSGGSWRPKLLLAIVIALALTWALDSHIRPIIRNMASYQVKVFASRSINRALLNELDTSGIRYDELVHVTQNDKGMVTSVQSDMVKINSLKARVGQSVVSDLEAMNRSSIFVPLGTLLGNEFFSGRGPKIEIKVIPTGYVQSEIFNQFTSAGINQTHHQVMLRITVQMIVILPGYSVQTETTSNFCVAETVIVGTIPEAFTQINGDDSPTISKINDYSASVADKK